MILLPCDMMLHLKSLWYSFANQVFLYPVLGQAARYTMKMSVHLNLLKTSLRRRCPSCHKLRTSKSLELARMQLQNYFSRDKPIFFSWNRSFLRTCLKTKWLIWKIENIENEIWMNGFHYLKYLRFIQVQKNLRFS